MPTKAKTFRASWAPEKKAQEGRVVSNNKFYCSTAWRKVRASVLMSSPFCQCDECTKLGRLLEAQMVDHIVPINQGGAPLDASNLQAMSHRCHNRKSGRERHQ